MAEEILGHFQTQVDSFILNPGTGGIYEVYLNDQLIFSKKESGRFPNDGEVMEKIKSIVK